MASRAFCSDCFGEAALFREGLRGCGESGGDASTLFFLNTKKKEMHKKTNTAMNKGAGSDMMAHGYQGISG